MEEDLGCAQLQVKLPRLPKSRLFKPNWKIIINAKTVVGTETDAEEREDEQVDGTAVTAAVITSETTRNDDTRVAEKTFFFPFVNSLLLRRHILPVIQLTLFFHLHDVWDVQLIGCREKGMRTGGECAYVYVLYLRTKRIMTGICIKLSKIVEIENFVLLLFDCLYCILVQIILIFM